MQSQRDARGCEPERSTGEARERSRARCAGKTAAAPKVKQGGQVIDPPFKKDLCGGRVDKVLQRQRGHTFVICSQNPSRDDCFQLSWFLSRVGSVWFICCLLYYPHKS